MTKECDKRERERRWWRRQKISNTQQVHHWGSTVRNEEICGECLDIWNIHLKVYGSIPRVSNIYDFKLESKDKTINNKNCRMRFWLSNETERIENTKNISDEKTKKNFSLFKFFFYRKLFYWMKIRWSVKYFF